MTCSACSNENPKGAKFCLECGASVVDKTSENIPAALSSEASASDDSISTPLVPKPSSINFPLLLFGGFAVVVILLMLMPKGLLRSPIPAPSPTPTPITTTSADRLIYAKDVLSQKYDKDRYEIAVSHLDFIPPDDKTSGEAGRFRETLMAGLRKHGDRKPIELASPASNAGGTAAGDPISELLTFIRSVDKNGDIVVSVSQGNDSNTAKITVANQWHYEPYQMRLQTAQITWKAWAGFRSPKEPDKARIKIVDRMENEVGGSRIWGGSLIWVKD